MNNEFNPLVSIVIPVYNGSNYMREAIDSALAQTYSNIEIILVNDGSTDNTDEIARSYGDKIRYFKKENGGVSTALNLAIQNMNGEYFSWLSHDDVYLPNKIEAQINALKKLEDKTTVINCGSANIDENSQVVSSYIYNIPQKYSDKPLYYVFTRQITGCGLLIHKTHFDICGLFNENQRITQDYDMWFRILRQSKILFITDTLVQIREHQQRVTHTSTVYNKESDILWCSLLHQITDDEIRANFKTYRIFYTLLGKHSLSKYSIAASEKIYHCYKAEEKKYGKTLVDYKNAYIIEKNYAYAVNKFTPSSFITFLIYFRHLLKKIILHTD